MEWTLWNQFKHLFVNIVNNSIGDLGFQHLSKSRSQKLQKISLSKILIKLDENQLRVGGCKALIKSNWNQLKEFYICSYFVN